MAKITRFEELTCWKASRELVKLVYKLSSTGNLARDFDTKSQLRRAALSMMNNIAEGFARFSKKEFIRFLDISQSSGAEVKSMIYVLEDLEYLVVFG
ncbi:four helix bundle protein [Saprospiraceae bacterium]|nr:four helix bundle protein [Saprospiraceae bacterium]